MNNLTKKYLSNFSFYIASFCAFLGMTNVFSLQGYLILASCLFLFVSLLIQGFEKPNIIFILIISFGFFYNLFSFINNTWNIRYIVYFLIFPVSIYFLSLSDSKYKTKKIYIYLISFSTGMFLFALTIIFSTFLLYGFSLSKTQPILSSVFNYEVMSRTGLSLYLMPLSILSFSYILNFKYKKSNFSKWTLYFTSFIVIGISIICSNKIGNRAFIVSFSFGAILIGAYKLLRIKNTYIKFLLIVLLILAIIGAGCLILGFVPTFLANIPVFKRFLEGGSNSERLQIYIDFFSNFYKHPFGGTLSGYVHNFWLDIYNFTGILPFIIFTYLFCDSFYIFSKKYINTYSMPEFSMTIFCAMVAMLSIGLLEPIFQANPFTYFFFVSFICVVSNSHKRIFVKRFKFYC